MSLPERKRAQTVGNGNKSKSAKAKELGKVERHTILLQTVKELGYDMSVFHLKWMPGEYLDRDTLTSVPMFWFKKFGWIRQDVEQLFIKGQIEVSSRTKREMNHVFGKKDRSKSRPSKKKDSGALAQIAALKIERQSSVEHEVNQDDS